MSAAIQFPNQMRTASLEAITLDHELQPRVEIDLELLDDYASAIATGAMFPPVVVFQHEGTLLLSDGYHRWHVHKALGLAEIAVDVRQGGRRDALLFSLAANAEHGKRRTTVDYERAYGLAVRNGLVADTDIEAVMTTLQCKRTKAYELTQVARERERARRDAEISAEATEGKSNREIARERGIDEGTVRNALGRAENFRDGKVPQSDAMPTADLWQAEQRRQQARTQQDWTPDQIDRKNRAEAGECVVANLRGDATLLAWAESNDRYVRVDRRTEWGNPFEIPGDGERDIVVGKFAMFYWPHKDGLLAKVPGLRGKVLGCWCHPEQCHGHIIAATVNREAAGEQISDIVDAYASEGCS